MTLELPNPGGPEVLCLSRNLVLRLDGRGALLVDGTRWGDSGVGSGRVGNAWVMDMFASVNRSALRA